MKTKSAITGKFVSKKAAKARPRTTFAVDDYPARMLRKLIKSYEAEPWLISDEAKRLIANIKKRMGWK